jgi:hypothetical protein
MLNKVNTNAAGFAGIAIFALSLLQNPQFQAAAVTFFSHPNPTQIFSAIGVIAGMALLYLGKPVGITSAKPQ